VVPWETMIIVVGNNDTMMRLVPEKILIVVPITNAQWLYFLRKP
jgi:hypothetical protein